MKLNLYTIEHELGEFAAGASLHSDCNAPQLDYPILFDAGNRRYYSNIVYVATNVQLENSKEAVRRYLCQNPRLTFSCVCIGTPPSFCIEARNCDIIWTESGQGKSRIFNTVQEIFQHFDEWERELGFIVERGGGLPDLTNASLKIFENDLCVTDPFGHVLAYRVFRNKRFPHEQTDLIKEGNCLPKDMVFDGVEDEQEGQDFSSLFPSFSFMKAFNCTVLRSTVEISQEYALFLSIHPNYQSVGKKDCAPALALAESIKKLYRTTAPAEEEERRIDIHAVFRDVVQGRQVPDSALTQCAIARGWNRDADEYLLLCIDFAPSMQTQDHLLMRPYVSVCNRLQALADCVAFVVGGRVTAVVNLSRENLAEDTLYAEIDRFAGDYRLLVGASTSRSGLRNLKDGYTQAHAALNRCDVQTGLRVARFEEHALSIGLDFIAEKLEPERFAPRELIRLLHKDPILYHVLEAYLEENCNASMAAKRLGMQRSSFVYRLENAREALGANLEDADTRLLFLVSFKLLKLQGSDDTGDA